MKNLDHTILSSDGPLQGIRVLDLSRILAGPSCTQLLGDMGADIIKIERPGEGDDTRSWGPPFVTDPDGCPTRESAYFLCANRNKRSLALDISDPDDVKILKKLVKECDIIVENFKVGGLRKYGLDYESLAEEKPDLVYCSITGFGQTGPNAAKPGYDLLAQAYGGIMSLTGEPTGEPMKVGVGVADVVCGLYAATAILAALRHRDQTGVGQQIDIALVDSQISWLVNAGTYYLLSGKAPERHGNQHPNIVPYQVFEVSDGYVVVAVGNDRQYRSLCDIVERPDLATDSRFETNAARIENREVLIKALEKELKRISKQSLVVEMERAGVPGGPINSLSDVFASEQVESREMKISMPYPTSNTGDVSLIGNPIKFSDTPVTYRRAPPTCGEHTNEILEQFGLIDSAPQLILK
ncbi:CaiB/BaiF CoA transferase family protein [Ochrobactrum sp. BTU1]|uniref:CaiB/BaiF CoA transferase family protein n=1 Tax=Ochrobactrum sp. BTU1 TaxID=2840456 RepID=UPI001C055601|nr:CoA transferase [Ochrobactrum sp. BTU1]